MRGRWALAAAAGTVLVAVAGCSVELVEQDPASQTTSDATAGARPTGADETDGADVPRAARTTPATDDGAHVDGSDQPSVLDRAGLQAGVTQQDTCGGGDLVVARGGDGVEVTDGCGTLTVSGAGARVVAREVDHLVVEGGGAHVVVASVGHVTIEAAGVRVAWEDGAPAVDSSGADVGYGPVGAVRVGDDD